MKKIVYALCFFFLFTATTFTDVDAKPRTIKGRLYFSSNNCLILKTASGKKYNLKNYGSLAPEQHVKLEVETLPKGEIACDDLGTPVSVVKVVETYTKLTSEEKKAAARAKPRTIKGKLYFSSNNCLILKTVTGKKYNLKNYGSLEPDQRVKLEVERLPEGEIACEGPGTPVSVMKVVETYPKMTGQNKQTSSK